MTDDPPSFSHGRPHERESALTRDADARVRAFVLLSFPFMVAIEWPLVSAAERAVFFSAIAWVVLANAAGYLVPWQRLPRWVEMVPPLTTIVALWLMAAPAGGLAHGYAMFLIVPVLWLAIYADPPDIAAGVLILAACLATPIDEVFTQLPDQGSLRQAAWFLVLVGVVIIGVRPVIQPLRDQIRRTRRAVDALHASQAALVHDLRNPLAAVHSLAVLADQRLEEDLDDDATRAKLVEYLGVIRSSTARAEQIIEGVLELSQAGDQLPSVDDIAFPALVEEIATGVAGVRVDATAAPQHVLGHRPSIARLLANLLENAARHAPAGDGDTQDVTVSVSGSEEADGWVIRVEDDGRGFEPHEAEHLFEPWMRGADAAATVGSGLGLAIVAGIVEQHGGRISASTSAAGGASFEFTLSRRPLVAAVPDAQAAR